MMGRTSYAVLAKAIASFPATFGLRGFPGTFRICPVKSYTDDAWDGQNWTVESVQFVIQTGGPDWGDFSRCTPSELQEEIK